MVTWPFFLRSPLWIIALSALLFACATQKGYKPKNKYIQVVYDPKLSFIKVGKELDRYRGDLKQFSAELINIGNLTENIRVKYKFYDKDGFEIISLRQWEKRVLIPYETVSVQTVAPTVTAVSARLFIEVQPKPETASQRKTGKPLSP